MKKSCLLLSLLIQTLLLSQVARAWEGRGHHALCEVAVYLVKNPDLKEFLQTRPQVIGHLCNIPDTLWRDIDKQLAREGNPSHFLNTNYFTMPIENIPADYHIIVNTYTGKKRVDGIEIKSVPHEMGSLWWRADQFYHRAVAQDEVLKTINTQFTLFKKDEQNESNTYNHAVYEFFVNLGIMGHFVGDCSMPFHLSSDHDGWEKGHGGIHSYYEGATVGAFDGDLNQRVLTEARRLQNSPKPIAFLSAQGVIEKMRALSILSYADIDKVLKADILLKPSEIRKGVRTPATRESATKNRRHFDALIVKELARSSALLAQLLDEAYIQVGKPNLKAYRSFKYPFTPDFVLPDYYEMDKKLDR